MTCSELFSVDQAFLLEADACLLYHARKQKVSPEEVQVHVLTTLFYRGEGVRNLNYLGRKNTRRYTNSREVGT